MDTQNTPHHGLSRIRPESTQPVSAGDRSVSSPTRNAFRRALAHGSGSRGFTLIELMIVIAIIAILLGIAIPSYSRSIVAARERTLRSDLAILRKAIWNYTFDKQKAPQSLDDLRAVGYIDKIPIDPMTHEPNWEVVQEEVLIVVDQQDTGIIDVHSASENTASDGTAYNTW